VGNSTDPKAANAGAQPALCSGQEDPPAAGKAAVIREAARAVFMEEGYGAASMDRIALRAGVSKATLYAHFGNKAALFAAMVGETCRQSAAAVTFEALDENDPRGALTKIGRNFLDLSLSERALQTYRTVVAEAPRFPEIGRAFFESGPSVMLDHIAHYLARVHAAGRLAIPDPHLAAEQFVSMVRGRLYLRRLLGLIEDVAPAERERVVRAAVDVILRGYAPER
jgi:TetR/AcrR family transcriptional repressor of mexJK operon